MFTCPPVRTSLIVALALVGVMAPARAAPADNEPAVPSGWTVDGIPWQTQGSGGTRFALLEGRRDQAGAAFSYAFFIPAGT